MIAYTRGERLITVKDLSVVFGGKTIIRNINFSIDNLRRAGVAQGQVVAVIGPSGCGKTTLLRCVSGLQAPTTGSIELPDNACHHGGKSPHPGDVGVVFQNYPLLNHRTVRSNIEVAAKTKEALDNAVAKVKDIMTKSGFYAGKDPVSYASMAPGLNLGAGKKAPI